MKNSLRSFLEEMLSKKWGIVEKVEREVDPKFEISSYVEQLEKMKEFPTLYFKRVKGTVIPVITNVMASERVVSLSLGLEGKSLEAISERFNSRINTRFVEKAPVQQAEIDSLEFLPHIWHNKLDGGPYIDSGLVMLKSLNGKLNVGIYRLQIIRKRELAIMTNPISDAHYIIDEYKEHGLEVPVTVSIGHHPALYVAAASRPSGFGGELELAGSLLNEPVDIARGKSIDMPVIADSEIAIEGIIRNPSEQIDEGPFGEWPGYYSGKRKAPVIEITKITSRNKPIFYDVAAARREHLVMGLLSHNISIYNRVKADVPDLVDLYLPASGSHRAICYLSIKKRHEGEAKRAALLATLAYSSIKISVVVDDDIDVRNEEDVWWAVYTRVSRADNILIIPGVEAHHLNPSTYNEAGSSPGNMEVKLVIDATKPLAGYPERVSVPVKAKLDDLQKITKLEELF